MNTVVDVHHVPGKTLKTLNLVHLECLKIKPSDLTRFLCVPSRTTLVSSRSNKGSQWRFWGTSKEVRILGGEHPANVSAQQLSEAP